MPDSTFNGEQLRKFFKQGFGLQVLVLKVLECGYGKESVSAYDLQSRIHKMTESFWKPSPGSIYPTLESLAKKEFVRIEKRENSADSYSLTRKGRDTFHQILSYKLLTDVFMNARLYDTFDQNSIIIPVKTPQLEKQIEQMVSMMGDFAEQDKISDYLSKIEIEMRKEMARDLVEGIDRYIRLLQFLKEKITGQLDSADLDTDGGIRK